MESVGVIRNEYDENAATHASPIKDNAVLFLTTPTPIVPKRQTPKMTPPPKCLYEILGVSRTAADDEIKKAYKRQAFVHHPDKNLDNPERALENFKHLQHAYTILSDAHERAWYDSHRKEILRGVGPRSSVDEKPTAASATEVDIFSYFSSSAYSGYEGARGFYGVFAHVFDQLIAEEIEEEESVKMSATFGAANSDWSTVREFYSTWEAFNSRKAFAFADVWPHGDVVTREYRRAMEKENKRERARVRKEFNATVRELTAFVKKRDPRVARRRQEEETQKQAETERLKIFQELKKQERKEVFQQQRALRDEVLEEDGEELDIILANIALDERLERRLKRQALRKQRDGSPVPDEKAQTIEIEGSHLDGEAVDNEEVGDDLLPSSDESDEQQAIEDLYCAACRKPFRTLAQKNDHERSKKHKTALIKLKQAVLEEEQLINEMQPRADGTHDGLGHARENGDLNGTVRQNAADEVKGGRKKRKQKASQRQNVADPCHEAEDVFDRSDGFRPVSLTSQADGMVADEPAKDADSQKEPTLSKKEKRRLRERRKKESQESGGGAPATKLGCNTCGSVFASRTKLMRHVKESGHALNGDSRK